MEGTKYWFDSMAASVGPPSGSLVVAILVRALALHTR